MQDCPFRFDLPLTHLDAGNKTIQPFSIFWNPLCHTSSQERPHLAKMATSGSCLLPWELEPTLSNNSDSSLLSRIGCLAP